MLDIGGRKIGGEHFALIAGPCTVESREQTLDDRRTSSRTPARRCSAAAPTSRGPPRTPSRASGQEGLRLLAEAKERTGLPIVTELMDARDLEPVLEVADVIQIGARNMQNYPLLSEIGRAGLPGADQARAVGHARGAADGGRVHPQGGQRERDAVRARHPHVRDRLPLHAGPDGRPGAQGDVAPAGDRRPAATPPGRRDLVRAAVAGRRRRGRRRDHRRGPPRAREAICDGPQQLRDDDFAEYAAQGRAGGVLAGKALSAAAESGCDRCASRSSASG